MKKLVFLFSLLFSLSSLFYYFFIWPLPQRSGAIALSLLENPVSVTYDLNGIPHIAAKNETDAFRTLGYVIGQHRLFQLDIQRRVATGRLSEILGSKLIPIDKMNRSLGFRYYATQAIDKTRWSEIAEGRMQAFLEGLNSFAEEGNLSVEFKALNYKPDPFTKTDILAFVGYMSFSFQEAFRQDPYLLDLLSKLPTALSDDLANSYENDGPSIDKSFYKPIAVTNSLRSTGLRSTELLADALKLNSKWGLEMNGSNAWVASPEKSASGHVLIANDPHIRHSNPGVWFEASLEYPGKDFHGHFLSFVPLPILGWTQKLAWNLTMSELDDMDFFLLPKEGDDYLGFKGKKIIPKVINEDIIVKDGPIQPHSLKVTAYGPILDDFIELNDNTSIAGLWAFYDKDNRPIEGLSQMFDAGDIESFYQALSNFTAPGLSISYGDAAKNIAWFTLGRTYTRPEGHTGVELRFSTKEPPPAMIAFSENPSLRNPAENFIVTANHRLSNAEIKKFPGYYQPSDRARRIRSLLLSKEKVNAQDYIDFLADSKDEFFPLVKEDFILSLNLGAPELSSRIKQKIIADSVFGQVDNSAILVYRLWSRILGKELFEDEMGTENFSKLFKTPLRHNMYKKVLSRNSELWWDNVNTEKIESKEDILKTTAQKMMSTLKEKLGENQNQWKWGRLHTLELQHPLGTIKPLNYLFNLPALPVAGGYSMVNAQASRQTWDDFSVKSGPSTKRVIDFAHPTWSLSILPSGNSGHRFDRFHSNQREDYMADKLQVRRLSSKYLPSSEVHSTVKFEPK